MGRDVLVVAEHLKGKLADISYEMAAKARELAAAGGGRALAAILGHGVRGLAADLGVDAVVCADDPALAQFAPEPYSRVLAQLVRERQPGLVLVGNTSMGMDIAPALAAALGWPLLAYCRDVRWEGDKVVVTSQLYGGKVMAEAEAPAGAVVTLLAGAAPADAGRGAPGSVEEVAPAGLDGVRTRFKALIEPEAADVDITKEAVLVSVGRGIQSQDNIEMAVELADALGGALAASRPIIDNGWLPKSRQVGKSGQTVKPKLYLAAGISGAPEHLEGMRDAELIVAINTDPKAPIFGVAHYGVVADLFDILPVLTEKVREAAG